MIGLRSRWRLRPKVRPGEAGVATTELAILTPVLFVMVLLPIHVGLWWHAKQTIDLAATQALDTARIEAGKGTDTGQVEAKARAAADAIVATAANLEGVQFRLQVNGDLVTVDLTGRARYRVVPGPWKVEARAQGGVERFIGEQERR